MTARRTRLCFVLPSLHGGGAERAAVKILNALDESRWHKSMYLFRREGPFLADLGSSIELRSGSGATRLRRWTELRRFVGDWRPRLIVSFLSYFTVLAAARTGAPARVIFNQQTPMSPFLSDADYQWRGRWHRRAFSMVTRVGYKLADGVITTSRGVSEDLAVRFGVDRDRMRIVHNPVDLDAIRDAVREPLDQRHAALWSHPVFVAAGRLADAKNYPLLLDAFAIVRRTLPARLFILGQGDGEAPIRRQISELGLDDAVVMCGFQSNPWKYIARADAFVLTSRYEGFGNVLVESMACGVPPVATRSAGTAEIIESDVNGLLVDRHEPADVASALTRLLTEPSLHERLAGEARRRAESFSLASIAATYDRVLEAWC